MPAHVDRKAPCTRPLANRVTKHETDLSAGGKHTGGNLNGGSPKALVLGTLVALSLRSMVACALSTNGAERTQTAAGMNTVRARRIGVECTLARYRTAALRASTSGKEGGLMVA